MTATLPAAALRGAPHPLALLALALASACGGGGPTLDAGAADATPGSDAGSADAAAADAGELAEDAGAGDALPEDVGSEDAGAPWPPVVVDLERARPFERLSEYQLLRWRDGRFEYNDGVVPYELNTALFSDFALKARALYVPTGAVMRFHEREAFALPVGSVLVKSFLFAPDLRQPEEGRRLVETRLLVRYPEGWRAFPYLWREDGSDADYWVRGRVEVVPLIDPSGAPRVAQHLVPQRNQCLDCHEDEAGGRQVAIIGPKARHLNRTFVYDGEAKNQLVHLAELGLLEGLPPLDRVERAAALDSLVATSTEGWSAAEVERAARDYLDINCAHCHNPRAVQGVTSQLFLDAHNRDERALGICKVPGSAGSGAGGLRYDIVPGAPEASILMHRVETEVVGEMMPLIGRSLADALGVRLVRQWIRDMPARSCE